MYWPSATSVILNRPSESETALRPSRATLSGATSCTVAAASGAESDEYLFNIYSFEGLVFVIACYTFPFVFVLVTNALERIPAELEDASAILGGTAWKTAINVTIPLALPALLAGALVAFLQAMILFGSPAILALPARRQA